MSTGESLPASGRFQVLQVVRHEGAATLQDAFDTKLQRHVTLVTSPAGPDAAEDDRLAFRLPRMRHPNIVSVLDAVREGDTLLIVAECLESEPLSAFLARAGRIPLYQGFVLVLQLLSAIAHAQDRRLVHAGLDLEHVQVTPTGQPRLPAWGWSLSSDRQPNMEAAARMAQVLLSGVCSPGMRSALDAVLQRAQAPDPAARYQHAQDFAQALMAVVEFPAASHPPLLDAPLVAEPPMGYEVPAAKARATRAPHRTFRAALRRGHAARHALAACVLAALLVPRLVAHNTVPDTADVQSAAVSLPVAAPPAAAPAAPVRVNFEPIAPAEPVEHAAPAPAVTAPAAEPPPPAPKPAAHPRPAPVPRKIHTNLPVRTAARGAPHHVATTPAVASGCPYEFRFARDVCQAAQCSRTESRHDPACARMLAEQRAALARLRGTPD